jgi:L-histidine N-alpha-methyltransferase
MSLSTIRIDVLLSASDLQTDLRADVLAGLTREPKELSPKWFYDETGCELFEEIMRLPEYYPTRREREILYSEAATIARLTGADTLVELGSGSSEKTLLLLDGLWRAGTLRRYVPLDVSESWLRRLAVSVADRYPGIEINGLVGDFERHLPLLPLGERALIAFLGGTIGNMAPPRREAFLHALAQAMRPGDALLLGADLVKPIGRLEAAYDDEAGVTAAFNLNVLSVLNRELYADFEPQLFRHVARFDRDHEWVEMLLRSRVDQRVALRALDLEVEFAEGEEMRTEISSKFRKERIEAELACAGLELTRLWTDSRGDFSLSLAMR